MPCCETETEITIFPLEIPLWNDLRVAATSIKLSGVKPPTWTTFKGSEVLAFSDQAIEGNEEIVFFIIQMPHTYKEGSHLHPHVHWVGEDGTAGNVVWKLTYSWANMYKIFPAATTLTVTVANSPTVDYHNMSKFPMIAGDGKTVSSMLLCSLKRNSSNAADTFTSKSPYLIEFDIHYQNDVLGSISEQPITP